MIIGIISDAHGNFLGLNKCLDYLLNKLKTDKIFFLGDAVGYFQYCNEVLDKLREINATCLLGNHDALLLKYIELDDTKEKIYRINEARKIISDKNLSFLKQLVPFSHICIENHNCLFVHGSPFNPLNGYIYEDTDIDFTNLPYDYIFTGHTHRPFIKKINNLNIINVGSVGLPRDIGNLLSFATFNTDTKVVEIIRIPFEKSEFNSKYLDSIHPEIISCLDRRI